MAAAVHIHLTFDNQRYTFFIQDTCIRQEIMDGSFIDFCMEAFLVYIVIEHLSNKISGYD